MYPARVAYSALFFVLVMVLVFVAKPSFVFGAGVEGGASSALRPFGVEPGQTLFPLGVLTVVAAVGSFFVFSLVDVVCA